MRFGALGISLTIALAAPGCGYATAPTTPAASFALDAGNYTLKISGTGICSNGTIEGSATVTVSRSGTSWAIRSTSNSDSLAMSLTTDGVVTGSVRGDISGVISPAAGWTVSPAGSITGANSATNVAGGPITNPASAGPSIVVSFTSPTGGGSCVGATWTLTPR